MFATKKNSTIYIANSLLHRGKSKVLPTHTCPKALAVQLSEYFVSKISTLRERLQVQQVASTDTPGRLCGEDAQFELTDFQPATETEVLKLLQRSASKTCELDPIPTKLVKDCAPLLAAAITTIINKCLTEDMPATMKTAIVTPILKKPQLDSEKLHNYRPISNLSFLSKLTEKIVADRLISHLKQNDLQEPLQSAYRQYCSTETALLKVHDHILTTIDQRKGVLLLLLDLSAAFDTVDHAILLNVLEKRIGVKGRSLAWITSYLEHRQQAVVVPDGKSDNQVLSCGVPQGSVLGPLLFTIYTQPLADILREYGLSYHLYADDTQLYLEFKLDNEISQEEAIRKTEVCAAAVRSWMAKNMLRLNDDKTELLIIYPKSASVGSLPNVTITIGDSHVTPSTQVRNLGVVFDSTMAMDRHVANICRAAYFHLHRIGRIRRYLDQHSAKQLVHALVISRLDSCNGLLSGLPSALLQQLQRVQNACARVIVGCAKYGHITPVLKQLHWLPVQSRIHYSILTLTFKCLHGLAPAYLADLLTTYHPVRSLRSSSQLLLVQPGSRTKIGERAFSRAAPILWNKLPLAVRQCNNIRQFKVSLKTYLFREHYGQ